jgi:hypothetical protein
LRFFGFLWSFCFSYLIFCNRLLSLGEKDPLPIIPKTDFIFILCRYFVSSSNSFLFIGLLIACLWKYTVSFASSSSPYSNVLYSPLFSSGTIIYKCWGGLYSVSSFALNVADYFSSILEVLSLSWIIKLYTGVFTLKIWLLYIYSFLSGFL